MTDTRVLQTALSLNYAVDAFQQQALQTFDDADFARAGFEPWVRGRYTQIAAHDAVQAQALAAVLGDDAFPPCTYN